MIEKLLLLSLLLFALPVFAEVDIEIDFFWTNATLETDQTTPYTNNVETRIYLRTDQAAGQGSLGIEVIPDVGTPLITSHTGAFTVPDNSYVWGVMTHYDANNDESGYSMEARWGPFGVDNNLPANPPGSEGGGGGFGGTARIVGCPAGSTCTIGS